MQLGHLNLQVSTLIKITWLLVLANLLLSYGIKTIPSRGTMKFFFNRYTLEADPFYRQLFIIGSWQPIRSCGFIGNILVLLGALCSWIKYYLIQAC